MLGVVVAWWLQCKRKAGQQLSCWFADCGPCIVRALWFLYGTPRDTCMGDMLPETFFSPSLCLFCVCVISRARKLWITRLIPSSCSHLFQPPSTPLPLQRAWPQPPLLPSLSVNAKRLDRRVPRPLAAAIDWKGEAARSPWWIGSFSSRQQVSAKHPCHL